MPPGSRFATSPWRNFLATAVNDELHKQSGIGESALLQASNHSLYGLDSAGTTVVRVALADGTPAAGDGASTKLGASGGAGTITALALSPFQAHSSADLLAVGTQRGVVKVFSGDTADSTLAEGSAEGGAVQAVAFHPHASDLLLVGRMTGVIVTQLRAKELHDAMKIQLADKIQLHSAGWNVEGDLLAFTSSDQRLSLWDPRTSTSQPVASADGIHGAKLRPTRLAFTQSHILTSGFDLGRQREIAVWDARALGKPVHRSSIPTSSTAVLSPVVDTDRSLVYLHGRGDVSVHMADLSLAPFNIKATPLPYSANTIALSPLLRPEANAMKGEIDRLYINTSTNDAVVPVSVTIPRRQYLDFHEDLFPHTFAPFPALGAKEWLDGQQASRTRITQDPAKRRTALDGARQAAGVAAPAKPFPTPATLESQAQPPQNTFEDVKNGSSAAAAKAPAPASQNLTVADSSSSARMPEPTKAPEVKVLTSPTTAPSASKPTLPAAVRQAPTQAPATSSAAEPKPTSHVQSTPITKSTPASTGAVVEWSRQSLTGSTPLLPEFNNVSGIATSVSADSRVLGLTVIAPAQGSDSHPQPGYLVFPLAGPGGRLGVHPLSQPGRFPLPAEIPTLDGASGTALVDFVCSPFVSSTASTAGGEVYSLNADLKIRKWSLPAPPEPLPAECLPLGPGAKRQPTAAERERSAVKAPASPDIVLDATVAAQGGRVMQVEAHPRIQGLVSALVAGPPSRLLVWDEKAVTSAEAVLPALEVDISTNAGAFGFSWSPDGQLVAVASADKKLRVGDVRKIRGDQGSWAEVTAHDGPRSYKVIWLSDKYLLTSGVKASPQARELRLYEVAPTGDGLSIKVVESLSLDPSPTLYVPWWDADSRILLLYARGERAVNAYEVRLPGTAPAQASEQAAAPKRRYGAAAVAAKDATATFRALPSFGHASPQQALAFLTKRQVDVKAVEVAAAYLLSSKGEIQRVGWKITRARPEFFQDDIYPDTEAVEEAAQLGPTEWLTGRNAESRRKISLQPNGLLPLSLAPAVQSSSKLAKGPTAKELTDKEKEDVFLQAAFQKVKDEDVRGSDVGREAALRAPANDDWSDED
ncbi:hypothetical protein OC846_001071 [Tilletia horrida]|uniref:Coronin-7 n=1 Tax=Tilletia horrida TaxID=155126 RepID=A0AAN6JTU1_9BASI|nr:hypothetical protein OC846_001071 [Tilletia horrida]KAK0569353.1 hypothetical protein OC861_001067 [Tilletia horrida]